MTVRTNLSNGSHGSPTPGTASRDRSLNGVSSPTPTSPLELKRLQNLQEYRILDTPPEREFDDLAQLASQLCETPVAWISLVDHERQWLKAKVGLAADTFPREHSFCAQGLLQSAPLVVEDAQLDPRFQEHPLVSQPPRLRFFAGAPVISSEGSALGMIGVGDRESRTVNADQLGALTSLSRQVMAQLELRRVHHDQQQMIQRLRHTETALHRAETELNATQMGVKAGTWEFDLESGAVSSSPSIGALIGRSRVLPAVTWDEFLNGVHPADAPPLRQITAQARADGRLNRAEFRYHHPDGSTRWFSWTCDPIFGPDGTLRRILATVQDLTDRHRHSERLDAYVQRLALATEAGQLGVWEWDVETNLIRWDPQTCIIYGQPYREYVTFDAWATSLHPEDIVPTEKRLRSTITKKGQASFEFRIVRSNDGSIRHVQVATSALVDSQGHVTKVVGVTFDITERKQSERELEQLRQQLLEALRRGEQAELATNVLHNVGNVLNSANVSATLVIDSLRSSKISGLAKAVALLQEHPEDLAEFLTHDPRGRQLPTYLACLAEHLHAERQVISDELESLRRSIDHIKEIVSMQQSHARGGGRKELIRVSQLVEDSLRMNDVALTRRSNLEIIRHFAPLPPVNLDRHKVLQVLINLISNATWACDESGKEDSRLTLRISRCQDRLRIEVADNGVGIPAENLTRIFEHGFTTRKGGHGFGLHSGALAAREMGGSLTAQSGGPGQGASFTLDLPYEP